jgi:hypothetical protein
LASVTPLDDTSFSKTEIAAALHHPDSVDHAA